MQLQYLINRWTSGFLLVFIFSSSITPLCSSLFLLIPILLWLVKRSISGLEQFERYRWIHAFGAFYLTMLVLLPLADSILVGIKQYMTYLSYFAVFLIPIILFNEKHKYPIIIIANIVMLTVNLVIFGQIIGFPSISSLNIQITEQKFLYNGQVMCIVPLLFACLLTASPAISNMLVLLCIINIVFVIVLLKSMAFYTSLIAIIVMLLVLLILRNQSINSIFTRNTIIAIGFVSLVLIVMPVKAGSDIVRYYHYLSEIITDNEFHSFISQHLVQGVGLDGYSRFYFTYDITGSFNNIVGNLPSSYINLLVETGILGAISFLGLFGILLQNQYSLYKANPSNWWAVGSLLLIIGFLIEFTTFHYFSIPNIMYLFFFILGISYSNSSGVTYDESC